MRDRRSRPGKLVALGEYAVLDGAPALVLAVDRYCDARLRRSGRRPLPSRDTVHRGRGAPVRAGKLERRCARRPRERAPPGLPPWRGTLDSAAFWSGRDKLGFGSSAAALWPGPAHGAHTLRPHGVPTDAPTLAALDRAAPAVPGRAGQRTRRRGELHGGAIDFRLRARRMPRIGSVRLPNSVGFAGIFAGRSASTPELVAHYRAWRIGHPEQAAAIQRRLGRLRRPAARLLGGTMQARSSRRSEITAAVYRI